MPRKEYVVLVSISGKKVGVAEKLSAHQKGLLHRAFSIFLFNSQGELLVQRRSNSKYHFAGLWSNACCSHPRPSEKILPAAKRRLQEELGIKATLTIKDHILYSFKDEKSGLIEHEFDYVLSGNFDGVITFNRNEISAVKWISISEVNEWIKSRPEDFTPWFVPALKKIISKD